jgi:hypothetical protein
MSVLDADAAISGCVPMNEEAAHSLSIAIEPGAEGNRIYDI